MSAHQHLPDDVIARHKLTPDEYAEIVRRLSRPPNLVELGVFSVMWSEHCAYKSSRAHFHLFPTDGPTVIQGPGENAGIVDIGTDAEGHTWGAAFKMESHNHPSFIEPFQGAATGVGGILRDVFTMGARTIACMDALRFGEASHPKTKTLVSGVVHGIGGYGNCMGVPTIGGNCGFDACYNGNILVNAFALGIVRKDKIFLGYASGVGNPVLYIGSATGRDGIHGATMASASFDETSAEKRPTVQVGDPFTEKLLLEACMEIFQHDWLVGIQDMGAAGLTSSSFEMASRAGAGMEMNLDAVPQRAANLTPYEMMLSESQERMLLVAKQGHEADVLAVCKKWGLEAAVVGKVTDSGRMVATFQGEVALDLPITAVVDDCPRYDRPRQEPADLAQRREIPHFDDAPTTDDWLALMAHPEIASKRWIWQQYDHSVRTNTAVLPGQADAAVLRVKENGALLAMSADCTERYGYADPYACGAYAVAESVRNLACVGAAPLGLTDCLNMGNPEIPEVMWAIREAMRGVGEAAKALDCPVVSGNVSLYNATNDESILPTPMIVAVGKLPHGVKPVTQGFGQAGAAIVLLGKFKPSLGASRFTHTRLGRHAGAPSPVDLHAERAVGALVRGLIAEGAVLSAHDLSDGGLAVALAECALPHGIGADCVLPTIADKRLDELLFGESGGTILVSVAPERVAEVRQKARALNVPIATLGTTGGETVNLAGLSLGIAELDDAWQHGFERAVLGKAR